LIDQELCYDIFMSHYNTFARTHQESVPNGYSTALLTIVLHIDSIVPLNLGFPVAGTDNTSEASRNRRPPDSTLLQAGAGWCVVRPQS
jgi:hypothetical protein